MNVESFRSLVFRNLANIVTALRIPLSLVLLWEVVYHRDWTVPIIALVAAAISTDFLDGLIARGLKIESAVGGAMDVIADKLFLAVMFLFLILDGRIDFSLKVITVHIAVVETGLLVYWLMGIKRKMDVSTVKVKNGRGPGQWKMGLICIAILFCLSNIIVEERCGPKYHFWANVLLHTIFVVSFVFAIKSFLSRREKYNAHVANCDSAIKREN